MTRAEIHYLREAGLAGGEIAQQTGCHERSVRNVLTEPLPAAATASATWTRN